MGLEPQTPPLMRALELAQRCQVLEMAQPSPSSLFAEVSRVALPELQEQEWLSWCPMSQLEAAAYTS